MHNKIIFLAISIILLGCGADLMQKSTTSIYAPKNFRSLGMVKYLNTGSDMIIESRRENAYMKMFENCGGRNYKVEFERAEIFYWYIYYRCIIRKKKEGGKL